MSSKPLEYTSMVESSCLEFVQKNFPNLLSNLNSPDEDATLPPDHPADATSPPEDATSPPDDAASSPNVDAV